MFTKCYLHYIMNSITHFSLSFPTNCYLISHSGLFRCISYCWQISRIKSKFLYFNIIKFPLFPIIESTFPIFIRSKLRK
nr:MAG TPA: hypothetical protein [Bacteriophage sp.]